MRTRRKLAQKRMDSARERDCGLQISRYEISKRRFIAWRRVTLPAAHNPHTQALVRVTDIDHRAGCEALESELVITSPASPLVARPCVAEGFCVLLGHAHGHLPAARLLL